jgi:hypothetical protein
VSDTMNGDDQYVYAVCWYARQWHEIKEGSYYLRMEPRGRREGAGKTMNIRKGKGLMDRSMDGTEKRLSHPFPHGCHHVVYHLCIAMLV